MSALRDTHSEIASWALVERTALVAGGYFDTLWEHLYDDTWERAICELERRGCDKDVYDDLAYFFIETLT